LLRAGSGLYALGLGQHQSQLRASASRLPAYVISVGNLVVGGTGKTPLTLWLAGYLRRKGLRAAILSRGYGRASSTIARVPADGRTAIQSLQFGDEPALMARKAGGVPVWVGRNRRASGAEAIRDSAAQILLLDDGFQHLSLHRDLDFVLLDASNPFGNGFLLPLGPLREPMEHLDRCHALVLTRADDMEKVRETLRFLAERFPGKPVFVCRHKPAGFREGMGGKPVPVEVVRGGTAVAFAGIAHPEAFFDSLRGMSIRLNRCVGFPDHYPYKAADAAWLLEMKERTGSDFVITTEKDIVRLPDEIQPRFLAMELELDFGVRGQEQGQDLCRFLDERLAWAFPSP
jgi:tetraacyldisaccharide 4'-kinase